ncbi:MAG: glycosyl transferase family 2, partial [Thermoplasmata archaeon]
SIPGTNTTYKKEILQELGGFDPHFVTAEDIDLNLRAVDAGYKIYFEKKAIVYRYSRENIVDFIKQAFRNGYGRKQLVLKHGKLWKSYSIQEIIKTQFTIFGILRLIFGIFGYLSCGLTSKRTTPEQ